jgi:hypothetical protein
MKNRLYIFITIILAAFLCFTSCKSEVDKADTKKISISVKFPSLDKINSNASLKSEAELNARKAYLTEEEVANIINSYTFTLMAKRLESEFGELSDLEAKTVLSGFSYEELQEATFDIQAGPWLFTLYAYSTVTGEICLSGTYTAAITSESVQLEFEMTYVEGALGIFKFTVPLSYTYEEELGAIPGYYHKIVIRSLDSPDKDYLVYEYNKNDDRVSTLFKTDTSGTSEKSYCTYSVKLEVGKYIAFVYDVKNSNPASGVLAYKSHPFNYGGEIVYIYGGVTTSKEYLTSTDGSAQNVDVELYIGKNRDEEITKNNCWGDFPGTKYDYDAKSGCLTFKNTFTLDNFYLPKLCFADEYLVGWYTDKECTEKADYLNYIDCGGQADRLGDVKYFIYDLTKVAGTLKLYAKFAPRYDILIETFGDTLAYDEPLKSFNEELVEPESGSTIWTLKNCAYEMPISRFSIEKYDDDYNKYLCLGWYYDQSFTMPASGLLNESFTGLDPEGKQIKLYPRLLNPNAKMYLQIMDGSENITKQIGQTFYSEEIDIDLDYGCKAYVYKSEIPKKDGYKFTGMYLDADFETEVSIDYVQGTRSYVYNFDANDFVEDQYITFYAKYERYTNYTFSANEGSWADDAAESVVSGLPGEPVEAPEAPARFGYEFNGWDKTIPENFGTEDVTFTAQWSANTNSFTIEMEQIGTDTITENLMLSIYECYVDGIKNLTITATPESYESYTLLIDGTLAPLYSDKANNIFQANVAPGVHTLTLIVEVEGEAYSYTKDITITEGD